MGGGDVQAAMAGWGEHGIPPDRVIDGAMADVKIKVVDDLGEPVSDATISITFYTAPEKVDVKRGKTDAQGCFFAKGRCIGEMHAWILPANSRMPIKLTLMSYSQNRSCLNGNVRTITC